jgi:hypothetical protein
MKLPRKYINNILLFILILILVENELFSQVKTDSLKRQPRFFMGINSGVSMNKIINKGILTVSNMTPDNKIKYSGSFGLELGYLISRSIGISTGVGYNSYSAEFSLNAYTNKFSTIDSEDETYERQVSGSDLKELQNISLLSVPVCLNFRIPAGAASGFFLQAGVNFSIPVNRKYYSTGTFTFNGYYPAYNILFHDLPEYGFPSDAAISTRGNLELKPYDIEGLAIAGFEYTFRGKFQIAAGATYSRSLSTISNYSSAENFQLSSDVNRINSLMGGSKNSITESLGLRLSLRYYIK